MVNGTFENVAIFKRGSGLLSSLSSITGIRDGSANPNHRLMESLHWRLPERLFDGVIIHQGNLDRLCW